MQASEMFDAEEIALDAYSAEIGPDETANEVVSDQYWSNPSPPITPFFM